MTFVAATENEANEAETQKEVSAEHFVTFYRVPVIGAASPVAHEKTDQMTALCEDRDANTLLTVARELTAPGVRQAYRAIEAKEVGFAQFTIQSGTVHA